MRLAYASFVTVAIAASAAAQPAPMPGQAPDTLTKVYECAKETDDSKRLTCYDAAVGALRTAQETGAFAAIDTQQVKELEREAFGFRLPSLPKLVFPTLKPEQVETGPETVALSVARLGRMDGKTSVVMSNGQVWIILDTEVNRHIKAGAAVTIRAASLDSYLLSAEKGGASLRVRRVQ
jgi:hypothetical protein